MEYSAPGSVQIEPGTSELVKTHVAFNPADKRRACSLVAAPFKRRHSVHCRVKQDERWKHLSGVQAQADGIGDVSQVVFEGYCRRRPLGRSVLAHDSVSFPGQGQLSSFTKLDQFLDEDNGQKDAGCEAGR
jgi:hypothetical protein